MDTKRKILLWSSFTGAIIGYFLFHPLVMLLSFLMSVRDHALDMANTTSVIAILRRSFSMDMLPWSLSFAFFNGVCRRPWQMLKL
jgi:hypothetical protein